MRYLSWDIGIKNLSYCLLEKNENNYKIINWEIINLSEKTKHIPLCQELKKNKEKCTKKSTFYNFEFNLFCCKTHSKNFKKTNKLIELENIKCINIDKKESRCNKKIYYKKNNNRFVGYCSKHFKESKLNLEDYNLVEKKKDTQNEFERIAETLIKELDKRPYLLDFDTITIENQPAFKNPKMKSIQMLVYTYFLIRYRIDLNKEGKVLFLSANNKLKVNLYLDELNKTELINEKNIIETELKVKDKYKRNKELAKKFCLVLLNSLDNKKEWIEIFNNHKKKDDLADTFLMNIYQVQIENK